MDKTPLLADSQALDLESITTSDTQVVLVVKTIQPTTSCPCCHQPTSRVHSHYQRIVADLPWQGVSVQLQLLTRKFFCINQRCSRRIFCERLPRVVAAYGRQTIRFNSALHLIGLLLGGQAGAKLANGLGMPISPDTILRRICHSQMPADVTPRVLGVDDWAYRKRQTYGTILVDLENRRPVALLPDREAETLTKWLRSHPGVEVISRDRSNTYRQGTLQGAPMAIQVADRFHLLQNLAEALEQVFNENAQVLKSINANNCQTSAIVTVPPPEIEPRDEARAQLCRARRLETYQQVWELHDSFWTNKAIAQHLGISARTVYRYLLSSTFAERRERKDRGSSHLDPDKTYLLKRWNSGCRQARVLFEELIARGSKTSYSSVARYIRCLKAAPRLHNRQHHTVSQPRLFRSQQRPLTPRRVTWLVMCRPEHRTEKDEQQLTHLQSQSSVLEKAITLAQDFAQMVRNRQPEQFDSWLERANQSQLRAFTSFAQGLREDYDAVKAGMTLLWSNGPVEGQINRLKMLKRQMYGRASIELLSKRFLLTV